jgi:hypothetical protein
MVYGSYDEPLTINHDRLFPLNHDMIPMAIDGAMSQ